MLQGGNIGSASLIGSQEKEPVLSRRTGIRSIIFPGIENVVVFQAIFLTVFRVGGKNSVCIRKAQMPFVIWIDFVPEEEINPAVRIDTADIAFHAALIAIVENDYLPGCPAGIFHDPQNRWEPGR